MLMPGDVANEEAGVRYVMTNASSANARVMAVVLLPKGAQLTTMVDTNPNPPFGPIASFQGSYPLTVEAGEYSLVNLVLDFAPGAQIPLHFHGGPVVLVGMSGTLTLRPEDGPEHTVGPGQVVSEKAGARHEMLNISAADARILAGVLLPKGAELTTLVTDTSQSAQPAGMPKTGSDDLMPTIVGLLSLALRLLILGGVLLLIRRTAR
jgi:quercetin dioxygenase-like cupin family protein